MSTSLESRKRVVVFGAASNFGAQSVDTLINSGFHVNAVLRSAKNEHHEFLWHLGDSHSKHLSLYEADLLDDSEVTKKALDVALENCGTVFHSAFRSDWDSFSPEEWQQELVTHAEKGCQAILDAITRSPTVTRLVLTSHADACGLVAPTQDQQLPYGHPGFVFTESDVCDPLKLQQAGGGYNYYIAGKIRAEKMAFDWEANQTKEPKKSVTSLCIGHPVGKVFGSYKLDAFLSRQLLPLMGGKQPEHSENAGDNEAGKIPRGWAHIIHAADAARVHVAGGEGALPDGRYLAMSHSLQWVDVCTIMRNVLPEELRVLVPSTMDLSGEDPHPVKFSCSKLLASGFQFEKSVEDMILDFALSAQEAGLLPRATQGEETEKNLTGHGLTTKAVEGVSELFEAEAAPKSS